MLSSRRTAAAAYWTVALALSTQAATAAEPLQAGGASRLWVLEVDGDTGILSSGPTEITLRPGTQVEFSDLSVSAGTWLATGSRATLTGGSELFLIAGDQSGHGELSLNFGAGDASRSSPVLIADTSREDAISLAGLAWLEGSSPRRHSVHFAAWSAEGLINQVAVSPVGNGSQVALQAVWLPDGRALLVWSGFDGQDDEILWSLGSSGQWSHPKRLHPDNQMPDITPAIAVENGQAVAAWSSYDGNDYRLTIATLEGDQWGAARSIGGPGSVYPRFVATRESQVLLFFETEQRSWRALQVSALASGIGTRAGATIPGSGSSPPLLLDADSRGVSFRFSGSGVERLRSRTALWNE